MSKCKLNALCSACLSLQWGRHHLSPGLCMTSLTIPIRYITSSQVQYWLFIACKLMRNTIYSKLFWFFCLGEMFCFSNLIVACIKSATKLKKNKDTRPSLFFLLNVVWSCDVWEYFFFVLQATIGIDFLSKTMYLEDRTVSTTFVSMSLHHLEPFIWNHFTCPLSLCPCINIVYPSTCHCQKWA